MKLICPICGSNQKTKELGTRSGFGLVKCTGCELVFLEQIDEAINDEFFEDTENKDKDSENKDKIEYWSFPNLYEKYQSIFDGFFEERWKRIKSYHQDIQSMLDIGCGYGFFLHYVNQAKQGEINELHGIELAPKPANYARKNFGLKIYEIPIEDFKTEKKYDSIVMCDVLEHIQKPEEILKDCYNLLNSNGTIFIQVPNVLGFKLPPSHSWGLPHHLWQFSPKTLSTLLKTCGFTPLNYFTGVMGVIGIHESGGPSLIDKAMWFAARKFKIGNRLMIIARKDGRCSNNEIDGLQ